MGRRAAGGYITRWRDVRGSRSRPRGHRAPRAATRGVWRRDTSGERTAQVARREGVWASGSRRAHANAIPSHHNHTTPHHTMSSGLGDAYGPTGVDWRARNRDASHARRHRRHTGYATDADGHGMQRHECGTRTPSRASPSAHP
jgi:hypothetical protein